MMPYFSAELLDLKAAQALGRRTVDRVQVAVLVLELLDLIVDVLAAFRARTAPSSASDLPLYKLLKLVQAP